MGSKMNELFPRTKSFQWSWQIVRIRIMHWLMWRLSQTRSFPILQLGPWVESLSKDLCWFSPPTWPLFLSQHPSTKPREDSRYMPGWAAKYQPIGSNCGGLHRYDLQMLGINYPPLHARLDAWIWSGWYWCSSSRACRYSSWSSRTRRLTRALDSCSAYNWYWSQSTVLMQWEVNSKSGMNMLTWILRVSCMNNHTLEKNNKASKEEWPSW